MNGTIDIRELNEMIERQSGFVTNLQTGMNQVIVGQKHLIESLLIGLLADGHVLLEGVPGLAKTLAIKTLAGLVDGESLVKKVKVACPAKGSQEDVIEAIASLIEQLINEDARADAVGKVAVGKAAAGKQLR